MEVDVIIESYEILLVESILLVFLLDFSIECYGQNTSFTYGMSEPVGIFQAYTRPDYPPEFFQAIGPDTYQSLYVTASIIINPEGYINSIYFNRLFSVGNSFAPDHPVWEACENSIRKASKSWRANPFYYPHQVQDTTMHTNPYDRPNYGYQRHLVVFGFLGRLDEMEIDMLSFRF